MADKKQSERRRTGFERKKAESDSGSPGDGADGPSGGRSGPPLDRRQVLKTVGGGLGIALASGTASAAGLEVTTGEATGITSDAATLHMTVTNFGDKTNAAFRFEYGEAGTLDQQSSSQLLQSPGSISIEISGLDPNTTYEYRAFGEDRSRGRDRSDPATARGEIKSFTTPDPNPRLTAVTEDPGANITHCSAAMWGRVDDAIDVSSVDVNYEWREQDASSWNTTPTETVPLDQFRDTQDGPTAQIRHVVDGLAKGTTYEYRLTVSSPEGATDTGSIMTLTTESSPTTKGTTLQPSNVSDTSAVLRGRLEEGTGGGSFRWGPPSPSGSTPPNTASGTQNPASPDVIEAEVTGLDPETTYEYWFDPAIPASKIEFTTAATPQSFLEVRTFGTADRSDTSLIFEGELVDTGNAASVDVFFEYRQQDASAWNQTSTQTLTSTGQFTAEVTGLPEKTRFEFRVVATSSAGESVTTSTESTLGTTGDPFIRTFSETDITATGAKVIATLGSTGGADSADRFAEWGTAGDFSNRTELTVEENTSAGSSTGRLTGLSPGTTYQWRAVIEASDGESHTSPARSFQTEAESGGGGGAGAPAVDSLDTSARRGFFSVVVSADWSASDADGDLDSVLVEVLDGSVVDSASTSVSGSSASGSNSFRIWRGRGRTFDVRLTVTDAAGNTATETVSQQT